MYQATIMLVLHGQCDSQLMEGLFFVGAQA